MLTHFIELRRRILWLLVTYSLLFLLLFFISPQLFETLMMPLRNVLPAFDSLIATQITTPLITPIKLAADAAILGIAPFALWHIWRFVSPGLYQHERRLMHKAMISSLFLFLLGVFFGFYLAIPYLFAFLVRAVPSGVRLMPDMAYTVDFITSILLIFGVCFQIPLICVILVRLKLLQIETLKLIRPYVIVMAFIIGMLLTPPDVLSQLMLAIPLCILYEAGILASQMIGKKN